MAKIRIIAVPPGQATEWVRQAWVGLELPVVGCEAKGNQRGVLGGKPENLGGYHVKIKAALKTLNENNLGAAHWWRQNIHTTSGHFVFAKDVCELVE